MADVQPKKSPDFAHVILTRFNVRYVIDPNAPSIGVDPRWLENRFELFERYCLPSIMGQSAQGFTWIVFFDSATPAPFAEKARALATLRSGTVPVFCETLPLDLVKETVKRSLAEPPEWLLSTRLDNDDGLHADFVANVQRAQSFQAAEVLNFPTGIILREGRTYRRRDPSNAFISLSERFADFGTVFSIGQHIYAGNAYPMKQLVPDPMWLQVVHATNISNKVRGWRTSPAKVASGFPALRGLANIAGGQGTASILAENAVLYPLRRMRDLAIASARRLLRMIGFKLKWMDASRRLSSVERRL
jgi:Putative rhamnosyl transferase